MNSTPIFALVLPLLHAVAGCALADHPPGGTSTNPCSHITGPAGVFTCENVGGSALLVWNATQTSAKLNITGGITTINVVPGLMVFKGSLTSNGPVAFIGGELDIRGTITGSSVLLAAADTTAANVKGTLLAPAATKLTASTNDRVLIGKNAVVKAKSGDLVVTGQAIYNQGQLSAPSGTATLVVGGRFDVDWDGPEKTGLNVTWQDGYNGSTERVIENGGTIKASSIILEAHRKSDTLPTINNYKGTIRADETITVVTGFPGSGLPGTFQGINNYKGIVVAKSVSLDSKLYDLYNLDQKAQLQKAINGGIVLNPTEDNTPGSTNTPVSDSANAAGTLSPTSAVVPQLSASMSHMNATQAAPQRMVAAAGASERLRGEGKPVTAAAAKPRPKAKPVLIRGAFFGTKISAVLK